MITTRNSKKYSGLHFTVNHTGKMEGLESLSTSCAINTRCMRNALIEGSICSKCYASAQLKRYKNMNSPLENNARILSSIIPKVLLPTITVQMFRFESFGDLMCRNQVINYFNICKANPNVNFALWTKNPDIIASAIREGNTKPENLNIIVSSLFINQISPCKHDFIDKIFTVYSKDYIEEHNVEINCGARSCFECRKCYEKNDIRHISEKLK